MSVNQISAAKELTIPSAPERRTSMTSVANTTITQAVAAAQQAQAQQQQDSTTVVDTNPLTEQQELQNLRQIIVTWRDIEGEVSTLSAQIREKNKRKKALEEMILRIMKKYNIGALDLKGSGGRLLYRKQTTKATLNPKVLTGLLATHLKSETAAAEAIKYINENREARPRESLLYEKN
jgi:hypothetical protein